MSMIRTVTQRRFIGPSEWTCQRDASGALVMPEGQPTAATADLTFTYAVPSGVSFKRAGMYATASTVYTGISQLTMNGITPVKKSGTLYYWDISPDTISKGGTYSARIQFRANGDKTDTAAHRSNVQLMDIYIEIECEMELAKPTAATTNYPPAVDPAMVFSVPPQSVCIYDQTDESVYLFDGVTKIQHSLTMDIQEEPDDKKKSKYLNNARNNPDKLTIDVVMSDVYTGEGAIVTKASDLSSQQTKAGDAASKVLGSPVSAKSSWTRSEAAANTLHWLKEQRRYVSVITPQYVHVDMIISSVTINQDDNFPCGWEGQIVFQHAFEKEVKKPTNSGKDGVTTPAAAMIAGIATMFSNLTAEKAVQHAEENAEEKGLKKKDGG